jgi:hypothetical protein
MHGLDKGLEDTETRYAKELLEDRAATAALQKQAVENFLREKGREDELPNVDQWMGCGTPADLEAWLKEGRLNFGSAPTLTTLRTEKAGPPKFFIDYCGIRQCLSSDFTIDRVVGAIETIGTTIVELDADVLASDALPKRIFCVLESFATIKAKGVLLVCGPALQDTAQMLKLAEWASDSGTCKAVMDSATAKCRWEEEEIKIKAHIKRTVGFARTDKVSRPC